MTPTARDLFIVDTDACSRCGACALLAPGVFAVNQHGSRVLGPPAGNAEVRSARVALLNCPTSAIKTNLGGLARSSDVARASAAPNGPSVSDLFDHTARQSEGVRWKLDDVAWADLAPERAGVPLRALVREMAFSEHATYSATQRFMTTFADDVAFTAWLSVWFYEETRHPHILAAWLDRVGESIEDGFVLRGRVSTPFMKSKMGTLVTNIISEVTAATAYHLMAALAAEPVLARIAGFISGDEARHGSAFFLFARRRLERAADPARERLDALKVLHFWLNESQQVTHPINQMLVRLRGDATRSEALHALAFDFDAVKRRVTRIVGLLIDQPLLAPDDVTPALKVMTAEVHAR